MDERSGKVYVNNVDDRTISVLDGSGALIATLPGGAGSTFGTVSAVYRRYYLPNADDATLTIVDIDRDAVATTIPVGASPQQAIVDAAAGKVYVTDRDSNSVTIVDPESEKVTGAFGAGPHPSRIASAMGELLVVNENGGGDSVTIASEAASPDDTSIATEYRSAATSQYFHTADPIESRLIADGQFADGWTRTMEFWRVWKYAAPGRVPMYRLVNSDVPGNAYLYTPYAGETVVQQMFGPWRLDGIAYYAALPDAAGHCAADTTGLYSLINRSQNSDRRYTTDIDIRDALLVAGWTNDGANDTGPLACVPQLRRAVTKPHVIGIVPRLRTRQP